MPGIAWGPSYVTVAGEVISERVASTRNAELLSFDP